VIKAINDALERENQVLCPVCNTVNDLQNTDCNDCGSKLPRTSKPEDGFTR